MLSISGKIFHRILHSPLDIEHLTHWGRVTHICVSKLTINGSDNGLSPSRRQAIIWTNDGILLIGPLGTNFSEILSIIRVFSFKKMYLKVSSAKWRLFCFGLNELSQHDRTPLVSRAQLICMSPGLSRHVRKLPGRYNNHWFVLKWTSYERKWPIE